MKLVLSENFNKTINGKPVKLFNLKNKAGLVSQITNYGGRIVSLYTPDLNGDFKDIVLGYDSLKDYLNKSEHFFGAIIGRYGNRIANGSFNIGNRVFELDKNEGHKTLHGGQNGFHNVVWNAKQVSESKLELTHISEDGDQGFPGNLNVKISYHLKDTNELEIKYVAGTDKPTHVNLTNHSYFNLTGALETSIEKHLLMINSDYITPVNQDMIPLGNLLNVENTPFDFREPKKIDSQILSDNEQLKLGSGYDHNFVIKGSGLKLAASVVDHISNRTLEVFTTEPGVQFYSGNHIKDVEGKHHCKYNKRTGFCLETQGYPNSPNQENFPSTLLKPNESYNSLTIYKFGLNQ